VWVASAKMHNVGCVYGVNIYNLNLTECCRFMKTQP